VTAPGGRTVTGPSPIQGIHVSLSIVAMASNPLSDEVVTAALRAA
jgi:hypothetical protein